MDYTVKCSYKLCSMLISIKQIKVKLKKWKIGDILLNHEDKQ